MSSKKAWRKMSKKQWSDVHTANDFFTQHYKDAQKKLSEMIISSKAEVIIEVGSGTGEPLAKILELNDQIKYGIGLDFNEDFIQYSRETFTDKRAIWVCGDACNLKEILEKEHPEIMKMPNKLVIVVGNTLGILPEEMRVPVLKQMSLTAGADGNVLLINWRADKFGYAQQHFYSKMPALCGNIKDAVFDFEQATMDNPVTGYSTKWSTSDEVQKMVQEADWDVLLLDLITLGVVCIGRSLTKPSIEQTFNKQLSEDTTLSTHDKSRRTSESEIQRLYEGESLKFYKELWGGDDIHIGIYEKSQIIEPNSENIKAASDRSKLVLQDLAKKYLKNDISKESIRMADQGSAYGGMAIFAVKNGINFVSCVEISMTENFECRKKIEQENLQLFISNPGERSFYDTGEYDNSFHLVVSQESFCHAGEYLDQVISESARILKKDGILCFSDIMMNEDSKDSSKLELILAQIKVKRLATLDDFKSLAEKNNLEFLEYQDFSYGLKTHYENIVMELEKKGDGLNFTKEYQKSLNEELNKWIENCDLQNLKFGIAVFRKM